MRVGRIHKNHCQQQTRSSYGCCWTRLGFGQEDWWGTSWKGVLGSSWDGWERNCGYHLALPKQSSDSQASQQTVYLQRNWEEKTWGGNDRMCALTHLVNKQENNKQTCSDNMHIMHNAYKGHITITWTCYTYRNPDLTEKIHTIQLSNERHKIKCALRFFFWPPNTKDWCKLEETKTFPEINKTKHHWSFHVKEAVCWWTEVKWELFLK